MEPLVAESSGIQIDESREGEAVVLAPRGEIDMDASVVLRTALQRMLREKPSRLVVNLDGVGYMDSAGLATLVEAMRLADEKSTRLVLCNLHDRVRGIFEIARLDHYFDIRDTVEQALSE